ncbi:NADP-dependent oxidoreductase [Pedobacter sp. SYP-B3415]|uniref:NADP-dependent oxidoreductase n=1 Tax=Pedobacter sp. SYP-B3415 TaxID=2496641 RepID=UPI00101D0EF7|nr:NADP-dependent oxidoreductase [Pedobacter sp. SYP-B3415]
MKAFIVAAPGSAEQLVLRDISIPRPGPGEVLVRVKAISINPVDVKSRAGKGLYGRLKELDPLILGWDISGEVIQSESTEFAAGDEVFGMVNFPGHGQAYAEYVVAPAAHLARKPANITHAEAAASTLAALTAWQALVDHAKVKAGDRVLIHAASGGVGHFAVQLAKHLGAVVTGTSSSRNRGFVNGLGADRHIDYQTQDFRDATGKTDFVLDAIGGENAERSLDCIRPGGTLISIPSGLSEELTALAKSRQIDAYFFLVKSDGGQMQQIARLLQEGILKAHVFKTYPFDELPEAHEELEKGRTVGKIVVLL